ncbi:unnamed protein product [Moneuplotes crassus]|uniref:Protein kinase domain-containing protein n=1 Tax=Euplotes crassus TaxID=5936 RepID=A0AAD1XVY3_EUPCR|nr:unnamed protein product [Moneuplotes crassus]
MADRKVSKGKNIRERSHQGLVCGVKRKTIGVQKASENKINNKTNILIPNYAGVKFGTLDFSTRVKQRRKKFSEKSKEAKASNRKGYYAKISNNKSQNSPVLTRYRTNSGSSNLKNSGRSLLKNSKGLSRAVSSGNFAYKKKQISLSKKKSSNQRFMKSIAHFKNLKASSQKRKSKNNIANHKSIGLEHVTTSKTSSELATKKVNRNRTDFSILPTLNLSGMHNQLSTVPVSLVDSESTRGAIKGSVTTKNRSKLYKLDLVRHSADAQNPNHNHLVTVKSTAVCTENQVESNSNERNSKLREQLKKTRNYVSINQSQAPGSTNEVKNITCGSCESSDFKCEIERSVESGTQEEIKYLDFEHNENGLLHHEHSHHNIFSLLNKSGVSSAQILAFLKQYDDEELKNIIKLQNKLDRGWTLLHYISQLGFVLLMNYILDRAPSTDLNKISHEGQTPLHVAIESLNFSMIKFLLSNNASINTRDHKGKTPYDLLVERKLSYLVKQQESETSAEEPPKKLKTVNISVHKVQEKNLEGIFKGLRKYFNTKLPPKCDENWSVLEPPSSEASSTSGFEESQQEEFKFQSNQSEEDESEGIKQAEIVPCTKVDVPVPKRKQINLQETCKDKAQKVGPKSFSVIKLLGTGSFGEVYLVEKRTSGKLYAMKILKKDRIIGKNLTRYALTERNVMSISNHPFIVSLQYAFQTEDRLFLVMDYCPGGDLGDYLEAEEYFSEDRARLYLAEIVLALEDLHSRGIIFRDLKPENIVLDGLGHCKLTDFGLSKEGLIEKEEIAKSFCGSYAYLAPEMINKTGHGKNVDWYLLGVLLYEMLEGIPPFYDHDKDTLFKNILENPVELGEELSKEAQDLILRLLQKDPEKRLGNTNGASDIKEHPWFSCLNWKDVAKRRTYPLFPVRIIIKL